MKLPSNSNSELITRLSDWPKITIVTPNFNQDAYLEECMTSILNQGYPNLEYIVIDGESTDGSVDIIKKYNSKLSFWCSEPDRGLYDALNKGFSKATGEIMMWLNSDDILFPMSLFHVGEIFTRHPLVNWITGINTSIDEKSRIIGADRAKDFSRYDFYTGNFYWLQQESTAWRKSLWDRSGGKLNTRISLAADLDLWVRFFKLSVLYPCDVMIGAFRMRSKNQKTVDHLPEYLQQAKDAIAAEVKVLDNQTKRKLNYLRFIDTTQKILRYTYIFDWKIIERVLNKLSRAIHNRPKRIQIDRYSGEFNIV